MAEVTSMLEILFQLVSEIFYYQNFLSNAKHCSHLEFFLGFKHYFFIFLLKIKGVYTLSKLKLESKLRKQTDFGDIFNNQYFKQTHFSKLIH